VSLELAFHVIGVSHHTASVRVRELLVLTPGEVAAWLDWRVLQGYPDTPAVYIHDGYRLVRPLDASDAAGIVSKGCLGQPDR
jgi:hypothetical protein